MGPGSRAEGSLNINLSGLSPIVEPTTASSAKSPFNGPKPSASALSGLSRGGSGSPLNDSTSRLFPKRTRELQTLPGTTGNIWGPPTSGTSTPLFEIPESPNQDGFPDLVPLTETGINSPARRGRAGTLPSRISPTVTNSAPSIALITSKTSRPTPSTSPFRPGSTSASEKAFNNASTTSGTSALLSRLRAGSMPQRANLFGGSALLTGQSPFSTTWNSRTRAATLTSISSAEDPASPQQSGLGKEDPGVRTLDYLGLAETPAQGSSRLAEADALDQNAAFLTSFDSKNLSRFRSFSVNTQNNIQDLDSKNFPPTASGAMTPSAAAALEAEYEAIQERVRLHNKAVQDFALNASAARPRARTAGLVDTPQRSALRRFGQHLIKETDADAMQAVMAGVDPTNGDLSTALYNMTLNDQAFNGMMQNPTQGAFEYADDSHSQASRALWIGSIPNSTTVTTLDNIFSAYGPIESTRVLTHKNCGFVNFENMQDAVQARQFLNGKEIFPGSGPVRIGFAKAPSSSVTPIPGPTSQSPAVGTTGQDGRDGTIEGTQAEGTSAQIETATGRLADLEKDILEIVSEFGAQVNDMPAISAALTSAISYDGLQREITSTGEPTANRTFDAPRLRDIRKRIDNGQCAIQEVEQIAMEMLPEIAELSSDYLGNTIVQKLFEYCSEEVKEQMLLCIAPHLAEIGVHKNGTWAAQRIIDVCRSEAQIATIIEHLRPHTVPLFLDQFGNYVLQCCLRFGPAYNGFVFETMMSQLWDIAQGRFGARAMRACLESHHASKHQQRMLAAVISLHSVQLATNTNGALLLTWLLDTCTFPKRRSVLAPRLIPYLVQLCTHKVAYLTVLKVVNQRNEPEAREAVLKALFFSPGDTVLEQILSDQSSGVTFIFKILTSPFLDENMRPEVVRNISAVLLRIKAQPNQGYKRLMDEVGLSSRGSQMGQSYGHGHPGMNDRSRPMSQAGNNQFPGEFVPSMNGLGNGMTPVRTNSSDSYGYQNYTMNGFSNQQQGYGSMPYQPLNPQAQFQGFNTPGPRNNAAFMTNGYASYNTPPPTVDFRTMQNQSASPVPYTAQMSPMMHNGGFAQPYNQQGMQGNMYGYGANAVQQPIYSFSPQMQPIHAGGRGRRR